MTVRVDLDWPCAILQVSYTGRNCVTSATEWNVDSTARECIGSSYSHHKISLANGIRLSETPIAPLVPFLSRLCFTSVRPSQWLHSNVWHAAAEIRKEYSRCSSLWIWQEIGLRVAWLTRPARRNTDLCFILIGQNRKICGGPEVFWTRYTSLYIGSHINLLLWLLVTNAHFVGRHG